GQANFETRPQWQGYIPWDSNNLPEISQEDAEDGILTTPTAWSALRVRQSTDYAISQAGIVPDPDSTSYTYINDILTGSTEDINGNNRTTVYTYNIDGSVNTVEVTYLGNTKTTTYSYINGVVIGSTTT